MSLIEITTSTTILALLSRGKFSSIYCCRRKCISKSHDFLAIKVYPRESAVSRNRRILDEKKVLQLIGVGKRCPYIIQLITTEKDDQNLYFVMDCHLGGTLHAHIRHAQGGFIRADLARLYSTEIVSALLYLAHRGCIHRDVKPANCLIDSNGHVKLCDFGAATVLFDSEQFESMVKLEDPSTAVRKYTIVGTQGYIAPEVMAKSCGYSLPADWWSFGVLLFEMMTGALPEFHGVRLRDNTQIIAAAAEGSWPSPEEKEVALDAVHRYPEELLDGSVSVSSHIINHELNSNSSSKASGSTFAKINSDITVTALQKNIDVVDSAATDIHTEHSGDPGNNSHTLHLRPWDLIIDDRERSIFSRDENTSNGFDFIRNLLITSPNHRYSPWTEEKIRNHVFFSGIDWITVEEGRSPAPDENFNRNLGFLDLLDAYTSLPAAGAGTGMGGVDGDGDSNPFEGF